MRAHVAAIALASLSLAAQAFAQDLIPTTVGTQPPTTRNPEGKHPYWQDAPSRPFVSAIFDAGIFFERPMLQAGYGRPHWRWIGVEGYSSFSLTSIAEYAGAHAAFSWIDVRA